MKLSNIISTLVLSLSVFSCGTTVAHAQKTETPQKHHYVTIETLLKWYYSKNEVEGGLSYGYVVGVYDTMSQAEAICGGLEKASERVEGIMQVTSIWVRDSKIDLNRSASLVLIDVMGVMYQCPDQPNKPQSKYF